MFYTLFVLVAASHLRAQQYPMKHYSLDEGLSHSNVYRIFQDHRGFIWFCTDYGLTSYDGKTFRQIKNDSLLGGSVMSISENETGVKLISTIKEGIIVMTDSFLRKYPLKGGLTKNRALYSIAEKNNVWAISQEGGPFLYLLQGNKIRREIIKSGDQDVFFYKIVNTGTELLFATSHGLYRSNGNTVEPFLPTLVEGKVRDIRKSKEGTYWIGLEQKILAIKNNRLVRSYNLKPNQFVSNILADRRNNLWIALFDGNMLLLRNHVIEDVTKRLAMHKTVINDMMEDKDGNFWFATYDAGAYKLSSLEILNYPVEDDQLNIFCNSVGRFNDKRVLIGSMGRVLVWENGRIRDIVLNLLKSDEFVYFAKTYGDLIYVGTANGFFFNNQLSANTLKGPVIRKLGAISMCIDHTGKKWIGSYSRLYHLEGETLFHDSLPKILRNKRFNAILEDQAHNMWFGTSKGLIKYDGHSYQAIELPEGKAVNYIKDLVEDSYHRIWAATEGGLLCIEKNHLKRFTTENGLIHNKCNRLAQDGMNTLWVGTLRGLSYVDLTTLEIKSYGLGIYPAEVLSLCYKDSNTLFVGTATGLSSIKTSRIFMDETPPSLFITKAETSDSAFNMPHKVVLRYDETKLVINYIGLSFQNANTIEYKYKITGLDNRWQYTANTTLELPTLPSGKFTFVVAARKNNGKWGPEAALPITVSTAFYKTWWFISGTCLLFIVLIIKIVRARQAIKHRKKTETLLKGLNAKLEERAEELALSNQELEQFAYVASHDLQEPLRMITSFLQQLEKKYKDQLDEKANMYIRYATDGAVRMRAIILDLLEYSKLGRQAEGLTPVDFNELLRETVNLNRATIEEKNALVDWKDLPVVEVNKTAMQQVFQNLITNGLKYQPAGKQPLIEIKAKENEAHWEFSVSDDGIGIDQKYFEKIFIIFQRLHGKGEYPGTGLGLAICKKIVENHHGRIWVESTPGTGSTFYFTLQKKT